jgi:ribosome-binding protein aMBF1 (putative translation factor)
VPREPCRGAATSISHDQAERPAPFQSYRNEYPRREEQRVYVVLDPAKVGEMRQERGLSRRDLARRAGLAPSTVAKVEEGDAAVRLSTARGIGAALGVDPKSLGRPVAREEAM